MMIFQKIRDAFLTPSASLYLSDNFWFLDFTLFLQPALLPERFR